MRDCASIGLLPVELHHPLSSLLSVAGWSQAAGAFMVPSDPYISYPYINLAVFMWPVCRPRLQMTHFKTSHIFLAFLQKHHMKHGRSADAEGDIPH